MITMNKPQEIPSAAELVGFLCDYAAHLLGAGATCIRIEKNVSRMARAYGMNVEMVIMPRHIHLTLWNKDRSDVITSIATVTHNSVSFNINTSLSRLSWDVADGRTDFRAAKERFEYIIRNDRQNRIFVLVSVACANAAFCRLFGGDFIAMIIVGIATMAGYHAKTTLLSCGIDPRLTVAVCSFISAILGATDILFSIGSTPKIAIATSVLYLVPGIVFLNSFSDMLDRHYLCAVSRFAEAAVITCCLSAGLCAAMTLMNTGMF